MRANLIIADDHKMFLEGLTFILEQEGRYAIPFTAKNGKNVLTYIEANPTAGIDLLITDISMPGIDGVALNRLLKQKSSQIKVLIVSMHHDVKKVNTLIEDEVDGFVSKDADRRELIKAIDTILSGKKYFSERIKRAYADSVFAKKEDVWNALSDKEKEILKLIAMEHTTQEISGILCLSKHTIDSYRKNLISKLNVRNIAGLTKYAMNQGLLDE